MVCRMVFYRWSSQFTRKEFDDILDFETGGMLEVWADLYQEALHITNVREDGGITLTVLSQIPLEFFNVVYDILP